VEALPRLRFVDAFPVEDGGATYLALRDNEGYSDRMVFLSPIDALIAGCLDGRTTEEEACSRLSKQIGAKEFPAGRVRELLKVLDENLLLENERFERAKKAVLDGFRSSPERPAHLAGASYPEKAEQLEAALDSYFELDGSPGDAGEAGSAAIPTGLVSPHIDFDRGKAGYAWAYREILRSGLPDLTVILGVAHQSPATPFVLTRKDYGTPFGPARTDAALAEKLEKDLPFDPRADELTHRSEHSVEFQAVYLRYCARKLGVDGESKILPVLCSSYDLDGFDPGERTHAFLDRLADLLAGYKGRVCLLAGVDFAHIGPRFGDKEPAVGEFLEKTKREDAQSLKQLLAQDPKGFLESVQFDGNRRKVCGVSALYAFSELHKRLYPKSAGETLHYSHAADPAGGEVTFASQVFRC
jgi:AmmeMemoRadiSam system protein B